MEMIEVTGNSVESAISKGLAELNAAPADVMIEVLEEPNTGLFGFGAKEARVRMVLIGRRKTAEPEVAIVDETTSEDYPSEPTLKSVSQEELGEDAVVGKQVLEELLDKMGVNGHVTAHLADDDADGEDPHWMLNVTGEGINRLIGRRGETLSSMQYVVRLICSRRLQRRANIIVDAAGYKAGRSKRLRGLANRMAKQAVQQGRTITLEPMHPNERRIIHLTLRGRQDVTTRSIGEGRARKVTIVPN
ncbi:MAG: protein jag [Chloroflexi bacterium]|nr:protein jag [Chloroflexota bacterium]